MPPPAINNDRSLTMLAILVQGDDPTMSTAEANIDPRKLKSDAIGRNSVIAIIMLGVVILLISVCVVVGFFFYKKKMSRKIEGKVVYSRGLDTSKDGSSAFDSDGKTDSIKFFGLKRNGRFESNSSTSSTLPFLHSRQNSFRTRLPSNGISRLDSDLNEGRSNHS